MGNWDVIGCRDESIAFCTAMREVAQARQEKALLFNSTIYIDDITFSKNKKKLY